LSSGRLLKSADESGEENIREPVQGQDLRCLAQRKLKAHWIRSFRERKRDIARFGGLDRGRSAEALRLRELSSKIEGLRRMHEHHYVD